MNFKIIPAVLSVILTALAGCDHHHGNCSHSHGDEHHHAGEHKHTPEHKRSCEHEHTGEHKHAGGQDHSHMSVFVPKAVQDVMGLKTVHAQMRRVVSTVSFAGRYELNPDARKVVSSPVAGRITLLVRPLADVKKGDVLFTVSSPDLVARSREIALLKKRLGVYRGIKTPNAALENELSVKRAERESMLAGAEEKDGVVSVRAGADGMVESLLVKDGSWLETGDAAVQTVRTRDLRFKALAASSDVARLRDGMPAKVGDVSGRIKIGVGDDSGIVPVYVLFDSEPPSFAGERARAECVTDMNETPGTAVPAKCIVSIGARPAVFVKDAHAPERFKAVYVVPGVSGGGWTVVKGLPSHARGCTGTAGHDHAHAHSDAVEVVSEGAYELKLALPAGSSAKPAGHFHADGTFHEGEH